MEDSVLAVRVGGGDLDLQRIREPVVLVVAKNNRKFVESKPFRVAQEAKETLTM